MTNYPPEHCPRCGAGIEDVDAPTAFYCPACEDYTFHNPSPSAREKCSGKIEAGSDAAADQNGYPGQVAYARRLLELARPALGDARQHER